MKPRTPGLYRKFISVERVTTYEVWCQTADSDPIEAFMEGTEGVDWEEVHQETLSMEANREWSKTDDEAALALLHASTS